MLIKTNLVYFSNNYINGKILGDIVTKYMQVMEIPNGISALGYDSSDVDNLRASQRLATARLKAALDHCDCLQDALTRHCPTKVKELKHEFGETLERAAGDLSEATVPQTV